MKPRHQRRLFRLLESLVQQDGSLVGRAPQDKLPSLERVIEEFARKHGTTTAAIFCKSRSRPLVLLRHAAMYEAHTRCPDMSYAGLGRIFNLDHTSIMAGIGAHTLRNGIDHPLAVSWEKKLSTMHDKYRGAA